MKSINRIENLKINKLVDIKVNLEIFNKNDKVYKRKI